MLDSVPTRHKAIKVLLAITAGAYQTTLFTYLIQRDLFPAVMKVFLLCPQEEQYHDPATNIHEISSHHRVG